MTSKEPPSQTTKDKPANAPNSDRSPVASKTRLSRRLAAGRVFEEMIGAEGLAALEKRNWTVTGAGLVALGVVADLSQIFAPIALIGLLLSLTAAAVFGAIVFMRLKWRDSCIGHTLTAILTAGLFSIVLLFQQGAKANDRGAIAAAAPAISVIQQAIYVRLSNIEKEQAAISGRIDQLTDEVRQANEEARLSKDAQLWIGTWRLHSPFQADWVVTYKDDGAYFFTSPQTTLNGVWRASDGLFANEAPGTGLSDAGSYRFRDQDTLELTGKLGVSIWKREKNPPKAHSHR